jgi:hypothetical protein
MEHESEIKDDNSPNIIEKLQILRKRQRHARTSIAIIFFLATFIPVSHICLQTKWFYEFETNKVTASLTNHLGNILPRRWPELKKIVDKVIPLYADEFQKIATRDFTTLETELNQQLTTVIKYASYRWPTISEKINQLGKTQERHIINKLHKMVNLHLTEEEIDRIAENYRNELKARTYYHLNQSYREHAKIIKQIELHLQNMAKKEPDLINTVSPKNATGILLHLAGLELQSN